MAFAISIASSKEPTSVMPVTGPKISSWKMRIFGVTSRNTVGAMKLPFAWSPSFSSCPPVRSFAPSDWPIPMYSRMRSICFSLITAASSVFGSVPGPTFMF